MPAIYALLAASQDTYPGLASASFRLGTTGNNDMDDTFFELPHIYAIDSFIALQHAEGPVHVKPFTPHDYGHIEDHLEWVESWHTLPLSTPEWAPSVVHQYLRMKRGISFVVYGRPPNLPPDHASDRKRHNTILKGRFDALVMEEWAKIAAMRHLF